MFLCILSRSTVTLLFWEVLRCRGDRETNSLSSPCGGSSGVQSSDVVWMLLIPVADVGSLSRCQKPATDHTDASPPLQGILGVFCFSQIKGAIQQNRFHFMEFNLIQIQNQPNRTTGTDQIKSNEFLRFISDEGKLPCLVQL